MGDSDYSTTHNAAAKAHEVEVPVKTGMNVKVPSGLKGEAPEPPEPADFYDWPRWLPGAESSSGSRNFTDKEWQVVVNNRTNAQSARSKLFRNGSGWEYDGVGRGAMVPKGKPADPAPRTREWAQGLIWDELTWEGGYASINAYDRGGLTYGYGWAKSGGDVGLPGLLKRIWANCPGLRMAFLEHGIGLDATKSLVVVKDQGSMESGSNAWQLLIGSPELLAIFIKLGESEKSHNPNRDLGSKSSGDSRTHQQALLDAQYEQMISTPVGKPPAQLLAELVKLNGDLKQDGNLIMFMAHVGHATGKMWKYPNATNINQFLLAWKADWVTRGSGAKTWESDRVLDHFKKWGQGIAWAEVKAKQLDGKLWRPPNNRDKDIDLDANKHWFGDGVMAIWDPGQNGYHFYDHWPGFEEEPDQDLYNWVEKVAGDNMTALLEAAKGLAKADARRYHSGYDQSKRTIDKFGYRAWVVLDAVVMTKPAPASEKKRLYADDRFKVLPEEQINVLRKYLGDKPITKNPWDIWDGGDPRGFFTNTQNYSMEALLSTYGARGYAAADQLRMKYEEMKQPYGGRPWIAIMTVLNRGGGQAASWIVHDPAYKPLIGDRKNDPKKDQRRAIRQALGLPCSDDDLAAELPA